MGEIPVFDEFAELLGDQVSERVTAPATPLSHALDYIACGWSPVPVPFRQKGPVLKNWGRLRLDSSTAGDHFTSERQNVGVILGDASNGLVDIDHDCPEALALGPVFLPATEASFGHASNPNSHWLYYAPGLLSVKILKPGTRKALLELRSNTNTDQPYQTVFPGSVHEDGEPIRWCRTGTPATVPAAELLQRFHKFAAAVIMANAYPAEGSGRHDATLALIGLLTRAGWSETEVVAFVQAVRNAIGADRKKRVGRMAADALKRLAQDKTLFGLPTLREAFGRDAADKFCELIEYDPNATGADEFDDLKESATAATADTSDTWNGGDDEEDETPVVSALRFITPSECSESPSRGYVVKGFIAPGDVGCIFGAPGAGKSLISPHIGYAVTQGRQAFGMRTKSGRVFYVAAEDPHGMRGRVSALKRRHGDAGEFLLVEGVSDLLTKGNADRKALVSAVKKQRPTLIFIDTLAMAFPGLEENSAEQMGLVVAFARRLAVDGAAIVLIHHDTKSQGPTPRGHSLLNGALDMALQLFPKDETGIVRGKLTKNRNGSCDRDIAFRIATEHMGDDEDGDPVTVAVVDELAAGSGETRQKLTPSERAARKVLADMINLTGDGSVTEDAWREACVEGRSVSASDERDSRRRATVRAFEGLVRKSAVTIRDGEARLRSDAVAGWTGSITQDDLEP